MPDPGPALVLDTHIWLWLLNGEARLKGTRALALIESTLQQSSVGLAAISVWEIAMLEAKRRITLTPDPHNWVKEALRVPGIVLLPLGPEIALLSARLPGDFHGDPADRLIVATAISLQATLVTADERLLAYSRRGFLRTQPL